MSAWYRARWQGKRPHGYWDMGGIEIPPRPPRHILTDRADGTLWLLSHNADFTRVAINNTFSPSRGSDIIWGPYDGPYVAGEPDFKLFVRNGRLGYAYDELAPVVTGMNQARVLTQRGRDLTYMELIRPSSWVIFSDPLGAEYPAE